MEDSLLIKKSLETELNIYELDATNILHVHTKSTKITKEILLNNQKALMEFLEHKPVKMMVNATDSQTLDTELREIVNEQIKVSCSAMAIMSASTVGLLISKVFLSLISKPVPMKLFTDKSSALKWLRDL